MGAAAVASASARVEARHELALERHAKEMARAEARHLARHHAAGAAMSLNRVSLRGAADPPAVGPGQRPIFITTPTGTITTTNSTTGSSLPANVGGPLRTIYQEYQQWVSGGEQGAFTSSLASMVVIDGTNVGVSVRATDSADFNALVSEVEGLGMQVSGSDATHLMITGMLPIAQLPNVAQLSQTESVAAMFRPMAR
jgi:hypothetical protein